MRDRQLLLQYIAALPDEYNVETTQLTTSIDLERSMAKRLIGARYRKMSTRGGIELMVRPHNPGGRARRKARGKGLLPTNGSGQGRSSGLRSTNRAHRERSDYSMIRQKVQGPENVGTATRGNGARRRRNSRSAVGSVALHATHDVGTRTLPATDAGPGATSRLNDGADIDLQQRRNFKATSPRSAGNNGTARGERTLDSCSQRPTKRWERRKLGARMLAQQQRMRQRLI